MNDSDIHDSEPTTPEGQSPAPSHEVALIKVSGARSSAARDVSLDVLDEDAQEPGVTRLDNDQPLEPGHYWTAQKDMGYQVKNGDTLLLLDVIEFENRVHSVQMREHPRRGEGKFTLMLADFLDAFVPCHDAESIRQREQRAIMNRVSELQEELMQTQVNPHLLLEAARPEIEKQLKEVEQNAERVDSNEQEDREKSDKVLAKIHRRGARRSAAKGNPLTVPKVVLASEVGSVISQGIDASGVAELTRMANEHAIVAAAQGKWLKVKTEEISSTINALVPYMSERAAVALAQSSGALKMANRIRRGIESLDLYTGKGVDVFDICSGKAAATDEPLTLIQGKRYAEEELAAWADVDSTFDFQNQAEFFEALASNPDLLNQVLPAQRCVVTMCMTRSEKSYKNALEALMAEIKNKRVFLLVRNGENVHVVYSSTPSHEGALRLFPTKDELESPFNGWDGSKVSIRDIEFGEGAKRFDEIALCYKRFLILLCGLDHRLKLLGDFYPAEEQMDFMSVGFQARHFRFIADDESDFLIGQEATGLTEWLNNHNLMVQSGSRVFVLRSSGMTKHTAELTRRYGMKANPRQFDKPFIALKDGPRFIVKINARDGHEEIDAKCELTDENNRPHSGLWWLCVDAVQVEDVKRFRHSRIHRGMGVGYLRLMRRLESYLDAELQNEAAARAYLFEQATSHGGMTAAEARESMVTAIRNWRASRRGAALPGVDEKTALNAVLSLMVPEGRLPTAVEGFLQDHVQSAGGTPLLLTRSGKSKLVLYVVANEEDRAPYPDILTWGWVKRVVLEVGKTKLREASSSLVWLSEVLPASETEIRRWDDLAPWLHKLPQPVSLRHYERIKSNLKAAEECWGPILKAGPGSGIPDDLFSLLTSRVAAERPKGPKGVVAEILINIPVAAHSKDGRTLKTTYQQARAECVMYFFGDKAQRREVRETFLGKFHDRDLGGKALLAMNWRLVDSKTDLVVAHDQPLIASAFGWSPANWASRKIQKQSKYKDRSFAFFEREAPKRKDRKQPLKDESVPLSLNRAFDELMGASVKSLKRKFYKEALKDLISKRSFPAFGDDERKAREIKEIAGRRFVQSRKAITSGLVWSAEKNRSIANTNFKLHFVDATAQGKPAVVVAA